jgi:hypothetical protein
VVSFVIINKGDWKVNGTLKGRKVGLHICLPDMTRRVVTFCCKVRCTRIAEFLHFVLLHSVSKCVALGLLSSCTLSALYYSKECDVSKLDPPPSSGERVGRHLLSCVRRKESTGLAICLPFT